MMKNISGETIEIKKNISSETIEKKKNISGETIEKIEILSKLELSDDEKVKAKSDMTEMLEFIDKLNELDTSAAETESHIHKSYNVFRDDIICTKTDIKTKMLFNAPSVQEGKVVVPKTI